MKINVNKGILGKANKLINPIAFGIARLKESDQAMGGKPTARCKPQLNVWLTQTQSLREQ